MPARSKLNLLPEATRRELEQRLVANGFGNYTALADWLSEQGYEIRKSAVAEWGKQFQERTEALRIATRQAQAIVAESPDDEGAMSESLMRLIQERLFNVLLEIEVDPKRININSLGRTVAELARASVAQKNFAAEVREKARAAAANADALAKRSGMTKAMRDELRLEILGVSA